MPFSGVTATPTIGHIGAVVFITTVCVVLARLASDATAWVAAAMIGALVTVVGGAISRAPWAGRLRGGRTLQLQWTSSSIPAWLGIRGSVTRRRGRSVRVMTGKGPWTGLRVETRSHVGTSPRRGLRGERAYSEANARAALALVRRAALAWLLVRAAYLLLPGALAVMVASPAVGFAVAWVLLALTALELTLLCRRWRRLAVIAFEGENVLVCRLGPLWRLDELRPVRLAAPQLAEARLTERSPRRWLDTIGPLDWSETAQAELTARGVNAIVVGPVIELLAPRVEHARTRSPYR